MEGTPNTSEILRAIMEARVADIHVACPGRVVSYDRDKQVANVRPMVKRLVPTPGDVEDVPEELPEVPHVRVIWPRGGGYFCHLPLTEGDEGLLVFQTRDPSEWSRTGEVSEPADVRLHHVAHAVFLPGYARAATVLAGLPSDAAVVGKVGGLQAVFKDATLEVGGNTDAAALASLVDNRLASIRTAYNAHKHVETGATTNVSDTPLAALGSVASAKLKLGG